MASAFYDIHCHSLNLSHPNLTAFLERINLGALSLANAVPGLNVLVSLGLAMSRKRITNLLSVMDRSLGEVFLLMEEDVLKLRKESGGRLRIEGHEYEKLVLTPLMMDFGRKGINKDIYYSQMPRKPIEDQIIDLFNGIRDYLQGSSQKAFEIYPFLGINTRNYQLAEVDELLKKYFSGYVPDRQRFLGNMGTFDGDVDSMKEFCFAGIKVYPPLGFDPWPDDPAEMAKVEELYNWCINKRIPVTAHCSDGGYKVDKNWEVYTAPSRWEKVLKEGRFRDLKLNFAHFGFQGKSKTERIEETIGAGPSVEWRDAVIRLLGEYPNVFADFSYRGVDEKYYRTLKELMKANAALQSKILFGSDFMINLLDTDSYYDYLEGFVNTRHLDGAAKHQFCSVNPERFLFG